MRSSERGIPSPRARRGETLAETLISILLFALLMAGVASLLMAATSQLNQARREAQSAQDTYNDAVIRNPAPADGKPFTVTSGVALTFDTVPSDPTISDTQTVTVWEKNGFVTFELEDTP